MEVTFIILAILLGLILILVEFVFIPGTTIVGIVGFIILGVGIYYVYQGYGTSTGHYTVIGCAGATGLMIYLSFKTGAYNIIAEKKVIDSKIIRNKVENLEVGQVGKSISAIRPIGTGEFEGERYEVTSSGDLIPSECDIKIIEIKNNEIIIEQLNT